MYFRKARILEASHLLKTGKGGVWVQLGWCDPCLPWWKAVAWYAPATFNILYWPSWVRDSDCRSATFEERYFCEILVTSYGSRYPLAFDSRWQIVWVYSCLSSSQLLLAGILAVSSDWLSPLILSETVLLLVSSSFALRRVLLNMGKRHIAVGFLFKMVRKQSFLSHQHNFELTRRACIAKMLSFFSKTPSLKIFRWTGIPTRLKIF